MSTLFSPNTTLFPAGKTLLHLLKAPVGLGMDFVHVQSDYPAGERIHLCTRPHTLG